MHTHTLLDPEAESSSQDVISKDEPHLGMTKLHQNYNIQFLTIIYIHSHPIPLPSVIISIIHKTACQFFQVYECPYHYIAHLQSIMERACVHYSNTTKLKLPEVNCLPHTMHACTATSSTSSQTQHLHERYMLPKLKYWVQHGSLNTTNHSYC